MRFYVAVYIEPWPGKDQAEAEKEGRWFDLYTVEDDPIGTARASVGEFLSNYMKEKKNAYLPDTGT